MAESWLDAEEETQKSSVGHKPYHSIFPSGWGEETQTSSVSEFTAKEILNEILKEVKKHREETTHRFDSLDSANEEIIRLQTKLKDLQSKIVKFQTEIPKIYPAGAIFGVAGTVYGIFTTNLIYLCVGLGMAITAITGILEAKINARRGII
jgi:lipid II:glycine glycyltransferase (peptidoglycan interpeptide bridge formation enzyme)